MAPTEAALSRGRMNKASLFLMSAGLHCRLRTINTFKVTYTSAKNCTYNLYTGTPSRPSLRSFSSPRKKYSHSHAHSCHFTQILYTHRTEGKPRSSLIFYNNDRTGNGPARDIPRAVSNANKKQFGSRFICSTCLLSPCTFE